VQQLGGQLLVLLRLREQGHVLRDQREIYGISVNNVESITDPGCLSLTADPDFYPSRIPDPTAATKEEGEKIL
jgi:hypothetical protein